MRVHIEQIECTRLYDIGFILCVCVILIEDRMRVRARMFCSPRAHSETWWETQYTFNIIILTNLIDLWLKPESCRMKNQNETTNDATAHLKRQHPIENYILLFLVPATWWYIVCIVWFRVYYCHRKEWNVIEMAKHLMIWLIKKNGKFHWEFDFLKKNWDFLQNLRKITKNFKTQPFRDSKLELILTNFSIFSQISQFSKKKFLKSSFLLVSKKKKKFLRLKIFLNPLEKIQREFP